MEEQPHEKHDDADGRQGQRIQQYVTQTELNNPSAVLTGICEIQPHRGSEARTTNGLRLNRNMSAKLAFDISTA